MKLGSISPGVKQPGREAELRLRISGAILPFIACLHNAHRDNVTFLYLYGRIGIFRRPLLTVLCRVIERHVLFSYLETLHLR
jgi:hypothetical protein